MPFPQQSMTPRPAAFTLLEVVLAIGVLGVALAVLAEVSRLSLVSATGAVGESQASLVAESVFAQMLAGVTAVADASQVAWQQPDGSVAWRYSVAVDSTNRSEMLAVRVRVEEVVPEGSKPVTFTLSRWIRSPSYLDGLAAEQQAADEAEEEAKQAEDAAAADSASATSGGGAGGP